MPVLVSEALLVLRDVAVDLLEAKYFVFESLDIELFALAMRPLSLSVQLLSSRKGRLAVGLRTSSLRRVALSCGSLLGETLKKTDVERGQGALVLPGRPA